MKSIDFRELLSFSKGNFINWMAHKHKNHIMRLLHGKFWGRECGFTVGNYNCLISHWEH